MGPGGSAVILNMGQDLYNAFPADYGGKATKGLPVLAGVQNLRDVTYAVSLGLGIPASEAWYVFGKDKYKFELGGGCTASSHRDLYPLLRSGQINGLIGGLRRAAEYETLIGQKGKRSPAWMLSRPHTWPSSCSSPSATFFISPYGVNSARQDGWGPRRYGTVVRCRLGAWIATGLTLFILSFL